MGRYRSTGTMIARAQAHEGAAERGADVGVAAIPDPQKQAKRDAPT